MLPTSINKVLIRLTVIFILVACASCKTVTPYYVKNYLNDLASYSGIGDGEDLEENIILLKEWKIIDDEDIKLLDEKLDYVFLTKTISAYTGINNSLSALINQGWISSKTKPREKVPYETGQAVIRKAVEYRDKPYIDAYYDYTFSENVKDEEDANKIGDVYYSKEKGNYQKITDISDDVKQTVDATVDEVFEDFEIADSYEIDFSESEIIPYDDHDGGDLYVNHNFELMAAKSNSFQKNGFLISYSLNSSGLSVHVSKEKDRINYFCDLDIFSVKPTFKWKSEKGDVKNCFFTVDFKTTEKIGASIGRYNDYYLQLRDLDSDSFVSSLKSMIKPHDDYVEASLPICKIKTPIPGLPTAFINLDLLLNTYVSGKAELVMNNAHEMGFETDNGHLRIISKHNNKFDGDIGGSAKGTIGVNFSLEAATFVLADVQVDGGLKGKIKSTLHLYDEQGNRRQMDSEYDYSTLQDLSKENNDVKVCGDISLSWVFDIELNTPRTRLYTYGFNRSLSILDEKDQLFGNLSHIENGMFVKKCTRNDKPVIREHAIPLSSNKIVLGSYAEVLQISENYEIDIVSLPEGYSANDIYCTSLDNDVAMVTGKTVTGRNPGACQVKISSKDGKYTSYINILVSTG